MTNNTNTARKTYTTDATARGVGYANRQLCEAAVKVIKARYATMGDVPESLRLDVNGAAAGVAHAINSLISMLDA